MAKTRETFKQQLSALDPIIMSAQTAHRSSSPPPPLGHLTAESFDQDDGSDASMSSMSSYGLEEDECFDCPRRSMFQNYWERQGSAASFRRSVPSPDTATSEEDSCGSSTNSYERILRKNEEELTSSPRRRRIFDSYVSASAPTLCTCYSLHQNLRKVHSTSRLGHKPSCLRRCRYSGDSQSSALNVTVLSVSFSAKVSIRVFETPKELWASKGWSEYFTA